MNKVIYNSKPNCLAFKSQDYYHVLLDVKPEYIEEKKFKNSAFVKTGRVIPTGKYTAIDLKFYVGNKKLTFDKVEEMALKTISEYVDSKILSGFVWNGYNVWLSQENQQNYASWISAAKINKDVLPLTAKFNIGLKKLPVYYEFSSVEELEDLYAKMVKFINDTVNEGRNLKDYFKNNRTLYKESLS